MFENASLVERFLNYWRTTGHQRVGYLYGRYEIHTDVPLGIRAVVAAIYEPPQVSRYEEVDSTMCISDLQYRLRSFRKVRKILYDFCRMKEKL